MPGTQGWGDIYISLLSDAIREFSIYRWDDSIKKDAVKKENDHAMDDIRYFVATVLGREGQGNSFASFAIERN